MAISYRAGPSLEGPANMMKSSRNSPLVNYALRGLDQCWLTEHRRWSHIYHLGSRDPPNVSVPHSDVFYTLNVLLGLSRVAQVPPHLDLPEIFQRNAEQLSRLPVPDYAYGMALWSAAALGFEIPREIARYAGALLTQPQTWETFRAQDLGMLLTGTVAQIRAGREEWRRPAASLFGFLKDRYQGGSGLFCDTARGLRRRFASFASQVYLGLACYHYGELTGDSSAIALASNCVRRLIALQGPHGEWPWFYDAVSGRVLDFYEVYSVHQYGMAPALLEWAERYDVPGAQDALIQGFKWVLGDNQLAYSMLAPALSLSIRSQIRKNELTTKTPRILRSIAKVCLGGSSGLIDSSALGLRQECRSYELGWILWSFGQRADLPQLTHRPEFLPVQHSARAC